MSEKFARGSKESRFLSEDPAMDATGWIAEGGMSPESMKYGAKRFAVPAEGDHPDKFANGETPVNVSRRIAVKKPA